MVSGQTVRSYRTFDQNVSDRWRLEGGMTSQPEWVNSPLKYCGYKELKTCRILNKLSSLSYINGSMRMHSLEYLEIIPFTRKKEPAKRDFFRNCCMQPSLDAKKTLSFKKKKQKDNKRYKQLERNYLIMVVFFCQAKQKCVQLRPPIFCIHYRTFRKCGETVQFILFWFS